MRNFLQQNIKAIRRAPSYGTMDGTELTDIYAATGSELGGKATTAELVAGGLNGATVAEVNAVADVSARVVPAVTTLAVTAALHEGRIIRLGLATGFVSTLPAATGSGAKYTFIVGIATTTTDVYVIAKTGDDTMFGTIYGDDGDGEPANAWTAAAGNNTITLGGTTNASGGSKGDRIELIDFLADCWAVTGWITQGGTEVTPFSTV